MNLMPSKYRKIITDVVQRWRNTMTLPKPFGQFVGARSSPFFDSISQWFPCVPKKWRVKSQCKIVVILTPPVFFLAGLLYLVKGSFQAVPYVWVPTQHLPLQMPKNSKIAWRSFPDASASAPAEAGTPLSNACFIPRGSTISCGS